MLCKNEISRLNLWDLIKLNSMGWLAFLISVTALHSDGNCKCTSIVCNATQNAGCCEIFCKYIGFDCNSFFWAFLHFIGLDRIVLPDRAVSSGRISIVSAITRSGMPPLCIIHPLTLTFSLQYNALCIIYPLTPTFSSPYNALCIIHPLSPTFSF